MRNKGIPSVPTERSKVRVVMVEFEGNSGDLQQLAQTLANAVRPQQIVMNLSAAPAAPAAITPPAVANGTPANGQARDLFADVHDAEPVTDPAAEPAPPAAPKPQNGAKKKASKTPTVIENIDFTGQPQPFKEFMAALGVEDHGRRYLGITQWFKEHRGTAEIGADHIYTCYKFLNLPVPEDLTVAFRNLRQDGPSPRAPPAACTASPTSARTSSPRPARRRSEAAHAMTLDDFAQLVPGLSGMSHVDRIKTSAGSCSLKRRRSGSPRRTSPAATTSSTW